MPGNKVQVISKNTKYAPFTVDLDSEYFQIIEKVVWSGSKVDVC
jgi:phage repressor protein C with HTH and peptisase S24 domain